MEPESKRLAAFLEAELRKWDLHHPAENLHYLAVGLSHALTNRYVGARDPSAALADAVETYLRARTAVENSDYDDDLDFTTQGEADEAERILKGADTQLKLALAAIRHSAYS